MYDMRKKLENGKGNKEERQDEPDYATSADHTPQSMLEYYGRSKQ